MARSPQWRRWVLGALTAAVAGPAVRAADLPMLHNDGRRMVDPAGRPVLLHGCNLGNTLMLESWMFGGTLVLDGTPFKDGATLYRALRQRFGEDRFARLIDAYRSSYITARDFEQIKSFGFNVVRLPFDYRLLQSDQAPYGLKPDAFHDLDRIVKLAADAGVYVILDLHGTPGGQSGQDHTGEAGQNHLWGNPTNRQRTADLWRDLAQHYKDNPAVAAYDLINEPYGDYKTDLRPELATLMPALYQAVRSTGDQHVVFFPGALNGGTDFYGDPKAHGMTGVGLTEHYYPGLFGSPTTLEFQAATLNGQLPAKAASLAKLDVPYFVGEFNVVEKAEYPERLVRAYEDKFAEYGWLSTIWSYKLLKRAGGAEAASWYMVTNAEPLPQVDAATASYDELMAFATGLATMPLAANEPLRQMLTVATPPPLYLAAARPAVTAVPTTPSVSPAGYTSADLGTVARPGHTATAADGHHVSVYSNGADVHGPADSVRFVSRPATGTIDERVTVLSLPPVDQYSKAGVMARWGDGPSAAMAMVNAFPDGTLAVIARPTDGAETTETKISAGVSWPIELQLIVDHGTATGRYRTAAGDWQTVGTTPCPTTNDCRVGLAATSHADSYVVVAAAVGSTAADAALGSAKPPAVADGPALPVVNPTLSDDAKGWSRWGDGFAAADGALTFHPPAAGGSAGLWQDVPVEPGRRYTLAVDAAGGLSAGSTLELRLESVTGPAAADGGGREFTLNSRTWDAATLPPGGRLRVAGTAQTDRLRVLVVVGHPAAATGDLRLRSAKATATAASD